MNEKQKKTVKILMIVAVLTAVVGGISIASTSGSLAMRMPPQRVQTLRYVGYGGVAVAIIILLVIWRMKSKDEKHPSQSPK